MPSSVYQAAVTVVLAFTFALLHLLHLCAHLARLLISIVDRLCDWIDELLVLSSWKTRNVAQDVQTLKKKPSHLAVVWVPINYSLNALLSPGLLAIAGPDPRRRVVVQQKQELKAIIQDVLNLLLWAQDAEVREVTFYDERGLLKSNTPELLAHLAAPLANRGNTISYVVPRPAASDPFALPRFEITPKFQSNLKLHSLRFNLIDRSQGHEHLAQVTRELVGTLRDKKTKTALDDLNVKTIGQRICATSIGPPDLLMVLGGRSLRFRGFPPWQLNVTEIYHARSYAILPYKLRYREFLEALKVFGDCEQRAGT